MIRSILKEWKNLCRVLREMEEDERMSSIDENLLKELQNLLEPFHDASMDFQTRNKPTLHLVRLWKDHLASALNENQDDSEAIGRLKKIGRSYMDSNWILHPLHNVALFLHPQIKNRHFNEVENDKVLAVLRKEIEKECPAEKSSVEAASSSGNADLIRNRKRPTETATEALPKRRKMNIIHAFISKDNKDENELTRYMNCSVFAAENEDLDLFKWWKTNEEKFPNLFRMFLKCLCIPASTAASESQFALANFMVTSRRNNMASGTIDDVLFLKSAFDQKRI